MAYVGIAGLLVIDTEANVLALNGADNVLHLGTAVILLAVALGADKRTRTTSTGATARTA